MQFVASSLQFIASSLQFIASSLQFIASSLQFIASSLQFIASSLQFIASSLWFIASSLQFIASSLQFIASSLWFIASSQTHINLFKELPIHLWQPTPDDTSTLRDWLISYPIDSAENQISRTILINLNWSSFNPNVSDPLYLVGLASL